MLLNHKQDPQRAEQVLCRAFLCLQYNVAIFRSYAAPPNVHASCTATNQPAVSGFSPLLPHLARILKAGQALSPGLNYSFAHHHLRPMLSIKHTSSHSLLDRDMNKHSMTLLIPSTLPHTLPHTLFLHSFPK